MTLRVAVTIERWPLLEPFEIARETIRDLPLLHLTLTDAEGRGGRAEAAGVDYEGETPEGMATTIRAIVPALREDLDGAALAALLPAGGARNAIDCALWDLRAKQTGVPAWKVAGLAPLRPLTTAFTLGLGAADNVRRRARAAKDMPLIKLKVDHTRHIDLVRIVRDELPASRIVVDANESWTPALLESLLSAMVTEGVELIEQPLPRGGDEALETMAAPIPIAADESCTDRTSLAALVSRYQAVNIKLDKCGGLTEALALARAARALGLDVMVGNMCGTSLGMAPAFLVAQLARWVDLDGPLLQHSDRPHAMTYTTGTVHPPEPELWG
ncbi:MAG: dipeptide epimerase [Acidobacteria bacterium]|nr:dipeptide epimerase [Acidobacteriota bacterium]